MRCKFVFVAALLGSPATAQDIGEWKPVSIQGPYAGAAAATPSSAELVAAWPPAAAKKNLPGHALAHCTADWSGALSNCRIMVERPARAGFGEALLSLAPRYRLQPATQDNRPAAADVFIFANWPIPEAPPDWRVQPKPGDFATTWTPAAWRSGKPGYALMNCLLGRLGNLHDCVVVHQSPQGLGFGQMALRFASYLRFKPAMLGGKPINSGLSIPFNFSAARSN